VSLNVTLIGLFLRKKALFIAFLIAMMVGGSVLVGTVHFSGAETSIPANSIIASDTTWTKANSPYNLDGNVLVNNGVTLTIQAGTIVNLGSYYIEINGTLQAIGNSASPITFNGGKGGYITFTQYSTNWNQLTDAGCIIQNAILTNGLSINIFNAPKISNNMMTGTSSGIAINYFSGDLSGGSSGIAIISQNIVSNYGIALDIQNGSVIILNNTLFNNTLGINVYDLSYCTGNATVIGNLILDNGYGGETFLIGQAVSYGGISIGGGAMPSYITNVYNNTISSNSIGLYVDNSPVTIAENDIFANSNYNIQRGAGNLNMTYNWWGTTDTQAINQTIYDYKNDFSLGHDTFVPFLDSPNAKAPTFVNASASADGSISPSGIVRLNYGGSQTFTITPNTGYYIAIVLVNGTSVGAVFSYVVKNIQGATTISATFAPNPTPTPSPSPTSSTSSSSSPTASPAASPSPTPTASSPLQFTISEFPSFLVVLTVFVAVSLSIVVLVTVRKSRMCLNNPVEENG